MLRSLPALVAALSSSLLHAAEPQPTPPPALSTIHYAQESTALTYFEENPAVTARMVDRLVCAVTGQADAARAWRALVSPADRVGIKVCASGGHYFGSHRGIVEGVVAGLENAGIPRSRVVVWDRDADDLRAAGFIRQRGSYEVASIPPITGYDRAAVFTAPVLGKLIWGDVLFAEKQGKLGKKIVEADQLSSNSHLAAVLSKRVTKIINIPVLSDEAGCGLAGAIFNMTVPNIDNWRRFTQGEGDAAGALLDLYADERVGGKVVLHILDALLAQYASGPRFNPNYAFPFHTIYASKDPVALDAHALRLLEGWRKEAKLPPIGRRAAWLEGGEALELGNFAEKKITLRAVGPE